MTATVRQALAKAPRRPPPGAPGDPGRFPPGSVARRVNAETRLLLGGPRALLLQLAHPSVAAGVADHSDFLTDPFGRLWNTLDLTLTIGFGDHAAATAAAARVARTHATVRGERGGDPYRAGDPDLLAWVHATIVDTAIETYARFVGRIGPGARERYLHDMDPQAAAFGVPTDKLWPDQASFRAFVDRTVEGLVVSDETRSLGAAVLAPDVSAPLRPATALLRFVTAGLLPARLRAPFGLGWSPARERALAGVAATIRAGGPLLPDVARRWPQAREADARLSGRVRDAGAGSP
ncbi:MAG: oxygenase MpaB family protein [Planctomycetaceae bacterium]